MVNQKTVKPEEIKVDFERRYDLLIDLFINLYLGGGDVWKEVDGLVSEMERLGRGERDLDYREILENYGLLPEENMKPIHGLYDLVLQAQVKAFKKEKSLKKAKPSYSTTDGSYNDSVSFLDENIDKEFSKWCEKNVETVNREYRIRRQNP